MSDIATSLISDDEHEYLILQKRAISGADDGTYEWALNEIDRLREALREMLSTAEVDQLENLSICDVGSERAKMKNRAVASRCGMLLGKLRKIARAALGEGK